MNRMIHPRREFFADHSVVDDGPIGGHSQNAGLMGVCTIMQRVLGRCTARCKKGS